MSMYEVDYESSIKKHKKDTNYYDLYLQQKIHIKTLQKELTTYKEYGRIVRAIKYVFAYSANLSSDKLLDKIKFILKGEH